jgi:uncharacterized protein
MTGKNFLFNLLFALLIGAAATLYAQDASPGKGVKRFDRFQELSPAIIKPAGWLLEYLERQRNGLTGHPQAQGYPFTLNFWMGENRPNNKSWWPWEQTAYLLDGTERLGLLLDDTNLTQKFENNLNWVVAHSNAAGRLGPSLKVSSSEWPMAVFFKGVIAHQLATGDTNTLAAFHRHFANTPVDTLAQAPRHIANLEGVLRVYEWTGDTALLEKAGQAYAQFNREHANEEATLADLASDEKFVTHGVTYCEEMKIPVLLYDFTGQREYLDVAINGLKKLERDHLLVDGVPSSNEFLDGKDPLQGHETCDIADFTYSLEYLLMATGDGKYADMIERAVFNAGPGCVSKDFKALQYFSGPNQVVADPFSNQNVQWRPKSTPGKAAFAPSTKPMCCAGNVHRIMPNFAAHQWLRNASGGLVAALYAPSAITVSGEDGLPVTVTEVTAYPFGEQIEFKFIGTSKAGINFTFRIPSWCDSPRVTLNDALDTDAKKFPPGKFVTLPNLCKPGDVLRLEFPMRIQLARTANWLSLERGPLVYSYAVPETVTTETDAEGRDPNFPRLNLQPAAQWNYALDVTEATLAARVQVVAQSGGNYPLDPGQAPVVLKVPARKVVGWKLENGRWTPPMPVAYDLAPETEMLTLVPYGSTRLRVTCFPEAVARHDLFVTDIQVAGPVAFDANQPIVSQKFLPVQTNTAAGFWRPIALDAGGYVNLQTQFANEANSNKLAYVRATIDSTNGGAAILAVNVKDGCEVRLNGEVVHRVQPPNQLLFNFPEWIPVTLRPGVNNVMLLVGQGPHVRQYRDGWGVRIRCVQ